MSSHNPTDIFIGIDGGASRTRGVLFNANGQTLAMLESGGSNLTIYNEKAAERICSIIENLIAKSNVNRDLIKCVGLGIAGSSNDNGRDFLFKELDRIKLSEKALLTNDAEAAYQICCPNNQGLLVTVGTGVICLGKNSDGKLFRSAGKGHYGGDVGSGFWIGSQTLIKLSMNDEICSYNPLDTNRIIESIYQKLGIGDLDQDLDKVMHSEESVRLIASIAEDIIKLAEDKNEVALSIIQQATTAIADYIIELSYDLGFQSKDIILSVNGSVIRNNFFRSSLEDALKFQFQKIKWISSKVPAAYGAAILAAKFKGIDIKLPDIINKETAFETNS